MRWLLASWGSHGDLHPFLALGRGLIARGHQVSLVGHPDWGEDTECGRPALCLDGRTVARGFHPRPSRRFSLKWAGLVSLHTLVNKLIAPGFDHTVAALLAEAPAHDVIVAHHFTFPAPLVAELTGRPLRR